MILGISVRVGPHVLPKRAPEPFDPRIELRVLAVRRGSRSALAGDDAERLAREAGFLLVFGSRPAIKDALLGRFAGGGVRTPA